MSYFLNKFLMIPSNLLSYVIYMAENRKRGSTRKRRANKSRGGASGERANGGGASGGGASGGGASKPINVYENFIILKNWINLNRAFLQINELEDFDGPFKIVDTVERYLYKYKYDLQGNNSKVYTGMCYDTFAYMLSLFKIILARNRRIFEDPSVALFKGEQILDILKTRYDTVGK